MAKPWWMLHPAPASDHLNEQLYNVEGEPLLVEVVSRRDPLTGNPIEWVYCHPSAADQWRV